MMKYVIKSQNLNNSLVFYRTLFGKMPDYLGVDRLEFSLPELQLQIMEGDDSQRQSEAFQMIVSDPFYLERIGARMSRFQSTGRMTNECEVINQSIGLIDPDGYKWIIGDPEKVPHFSKCYITN